MHLKHNHTLQDGKYRIVNKIGQGGFGITYRAEWDTEVTGPMGTIKTMIPVAIKEFFFEEYCSRQSDTAAVTITSATGREMFERFKNKLKKEATILSRLKHPNIVKVLDAFEENNTAYFVMAYVEGESLKELIRRKGMLDETTTLRYAGQLCDALQEIHRHKILHLDIKPGNIIIDKNDNVQLIDFGISKQYDDGHQETSTTPIGISKGFAPIEQYSSVSQFTPSTDIYAVGATLYNMLTGKIPPEAPFLTEAPLTPASTYQAGISASTETVIKKAMSSRRIDRQQDVSELKRELEGEPIEPKTVEDKTRIDNSPKTDPPVTPPPVKAKQPDDNDDKTSSKKSLKTWFAIAGVIVLAIVGWGIYSSMNRGGSYYHSEPSNVLSENSVSVPEAEKQQEIIPEQKPANVSNEDAQKRQQEERERAAREAEQKKRDLQDARTKAENAFVNKQYSQALEYYKKVKNLSPGDETGYKRFLNQAKELASILGEYDSNVKALLLNARELKNTTEVNNLISQCR